MKKLIAVVLVLLLIIGCANAETTPVEDSQRPSCAWLGSVSANLINDLRVLSTDADFIAALSLPNNVASLISPAPAYEAEPSLVLYMPSDPFAAFMGISGVTADDMPSSIDRDAAERLYSQALTSKLYSLCSAEQLALAGSITLNSYFFHEYITPTIAFFAPLDGAQGDPIMITCSSVNGIACLTANYIPMSIYRELLDGDSDLSIEIAELNIADILRVDSEKTAAAAEIPAADEAWLEQTAFDVAQDMIDLASDADYIKLFTSDAEIIDLCLSIGRVSLASAQIGSITYYDADSPEVAEFFNASSPLAEKYYSPKIGSIVTQAITNSYGVTFIVAASICAADDVRAYDGNFVSCVVLLDTGGDYDVAVRFGMVEEGIVIISAAPIPAE